MMAVTNRNRPMANMRTEITLAVLMTALAPALAHAQEAPAAKTPTFGDVAKDIISPDAPGFDALGVTGSQVAHPETLKTLGMGLLNGLDPAGNAQTGIALQFSPAKLLAPSWVSYDNYVRDRGVRIAARFEIAAALVKGSDADKSSKATVGFVWRLIDTTDPYADTALNACINEAFGRVRPILRPIDMDDPKQVAEREALGKIYDTAAESCGKVAAPRLASGMTLQVGFAPLFVSKTGKTGDFKGQGFAASGLFSIGLGSMFGTKPAEMQTDNRFILGVTYRRRETVADPDNEGAFLERNRLNVGGRLLFGAFNGMIFGAEAAYQHARYSNAGVDDYVTYAATAEVKVASNLWLGGSVGGSSGQRIGGGDVSAGVKLKWGFLEKPTIGQ
jgi:hypothetical protein